MHSIHHGTCHLEKNSKEPASTDALSLKGLCSGNVAGFCYVIKYCLQYCVYNILIKIFNLLFKRHNGTERKKVI
jgi:hypothetical protein